jgi:hypothetical protein
VQIARKKVGMTRVEWITTSEGQKAHLPEYAKRFRESGAHRGF